MSNIADMHTIDNIKLNPVVREWHFNDDLKAVNCSMFEFRLVYQGVLYSNGNSEHKQHIRRYLHKQLINLWNTKYPLRDRLAPGKFISGFGQVDTDFIANKYSIGSKRYVPIVTHDLALTCG